MHFNFIFNLYKWKKYEKLEPLILVNGEALLMCINLVMQKMCTSISSKKIIL